MDHAKHPPAQGAAPQTNTLKSQAKRLRSALLASGIDIPQSASLELIAKTHGHRDWNTAAALAPRSEADAVYGSEAEAASGTKPTRAADAAGAPPYGGAARWTLNQRVTGFYLGHPIIGTLISIARKGNSYVDIAVQLDQPVNVSKSALFDAPRQRIRATLGADGRSVGATSDGVPHLVIDVI